MTRVKICGITTVEDGAAGGGARGVGDRNGVLARQPALRRSRRGRGRSSRRCRRSWRPSACSSTRRRTRCTIARGGRPESPCSSTATRSPGAYRGLPDAGDQGGRRPGRVGDRGSRRGPGAAPRCCWTPHDRVKRGGTGRSIDWSIAAMIARHAAGDPVGRPDGRRTSPTRSRRCAPYAIDVSSGVECASGRKDRVKLRALFAALNATDTERDEPGDDARTARRTDLRPARSRRARVLRRVRRPVRARNARRADRGADRGVFQGPRRRRVPDRARATCCAITSAARRRSTKRSG